MSVHADLRLSAVPPPPAQLYCLLHAHLYRVFSAASRLRFAASCRSRICRITSAWNDSPCRQAGRQAGRHTPAQYAHGIFAKTAIRPSQAAARWRSISFQ
jgi:hypothetical protein